MAATPSKLSHNQKSIDVKLTTVHMDDAHVDAKKVMCVPGTSTATTTTTTTTAPAAVTESATSDILASTVLSCRKAPPPSSLPTYSTSEASQYYIVAKSLLNEGDFEGALSTIEEGITATKVLLPESEDHTLHEAMAPFHYLYGTTLLYSIEESVDPQQQMTNTSTVGEDTDANHQEPEDNGEDGQEEHAEQDIEEQNVEDLQIAWENLETARTILEHLVHENTKSDKLKADLAQIHLRCGDLQRQNSAYENAINDYTACLSYRQNNATIPTLSRKIADVHYNLGLVYFNQVAETKLPEDNPEEAAKIKHTLELARRQGFFHLFECGKVFGGIVASLCGADPQEILQQSNEVPNFKTTGEEDDQYEQDYEHPKLMGLKLQKLLQLLAELKVPEVARLEFDDCVAVMQEIQETIEEAENSEKGVHEATAMKEQITAAVAAQTDERDNGVTTTIGFGSAAASDITHAAHPILNVKKKAKRNADADGEEAKLPSRESIKRQKSSE